MKYHLIGNLGISMSAISELLKTEGHTVSGSDLKSGGHNKNNIDSSIDVVVRTSAVNPGSAGWVEVEEAERRGIPILKRSELLGQITDKYTLIAISGMHGKTTTTSLAGLTLIEAGLCPTVLIGEHIAEFGDRALSVGHSKYFVMEACEYDRSFLDFHPSILILTNIEEEHLDTYPGGLSEIMQAFSDYLDRLKPDGVVIANREDQNIIELLRDRDKSFKIIWYGKGSGNYEKLDCKLSIPGEHNQLNALAIVALADLLEIDKKFYRKVFEHFKGAKRRLEYWGELDEALLYDDYGHHPTEIKATLKAVKEQYPDRKLVTIFWPHQYKRILPLFEDFASSFEMADEVFVKDIFYVPGRDEILDIDSERLAEAISKQGTRARQFSENHEIIKQLKSLASQPSIFLTIGIPPIYKLWQEILGE